MNIAQWHSRDSGAGVRERKEGERRKINLADTGLGDLLAISDFLDPGIKGYDSRGFESSRNAMRCCRCHLRDVSSVGTG